MKKNPRFFCENCGSEVRQNDKVCAKCGRFFSSVKCPSCGYSGDSAIFRDGCPVCGYAFAGADRGRPGQGGAKGESIDPLPWWVYAVTFTLCAALVAYIVFTR